MMTVERLDTARHFIYRHGDLLTRRRFAYHFEHSRKEAVLEALACYQNDDGGFGNGLELDILCPASSGICTEIAFGYLAELHVHEGSLFDRGLHWIASATTANGDIPHPAEAVLAYPHGVWWEQDEGRILSLAGLLGKMGKCPPEVSRIAAAIFEKKYIPFPEELRVYSYPAALYLRYSDLEGIHRRYIAALDGAFVNMLSADAWHHPLFFCHDRWNFEGISSALWESEAKRAISALQEDGGVSIDRYAQLPWWRPVWTVDMLVALKRIGLLGEVRAQWKAS